jgi:predicted Zn-dependent protease
MSPRALAAASIAALSCATAPERFEDAAPSQGLIEVLPRHADVEVDGVPVGPGSYLLPVRAGDRLHRVRVRALGFDDHEVEVPAAMLRGGRLGLALRPAGYGIGRPLDMDDPATLADAAAFLVRRGRSREAGEYAARAAELAPEAPLPRRVLGDAYLAQGDHARAAREYSSYLASASPDAPDRPEVERRVGELRGDLTFPGSKR